MLSNAVRNVARSTVTTQSRRMSSDYSKTFITADKQYKFSQKWLSDPATYPLIACISFAGAFCSGFGFWFLTNSKDVRISPTKRHEIFRRAE